MSRLIPGVLGDERAAEEESFSDGLLEYPHYTRPPVWNGSEVPEVLRSGHHANIAKWRRKQALKRTMRKRPDMFEKFVPDKADKKLLAEIEKELQE